jgi:PAS domain S-box-containing protein
MRTTSHPFAISKSNIQKKGMENRLKILLLEDDPEDLEIIQQILKENIPGIEYHFAANKNAFINALAHLHPDCILADNSVTGMNAAIALETARKQFPDVPFIMVTGAVPEIYAIDMIKAGADDYIIKDRLQRLPAAIEAAVNKYRAGIESKINAQRLKENEEKYRELVERITDAFIALDRDFRYTSLNTQAWELVHKDPAELIGKKVWDVFPDAVGSETYHSFLRAMKEQVYICSTDYYAPLDLWQENHIYPSPDGISIFIRDITKSKRAERQREFDRNNLSALINNTRDMMWSTDSDLRLVAFNNAFNEVVIGLSGKPLQLGDSVIAEQFPSELVASYRDHYQRALRGESFTVIDHFGEPLDLWSEISFYPIHNDTKITGIACFARDITEAKRSEQTMHRLEKEIMHQQIQEQKKIARAIIHAQEQERNRIGQELHDNVNQILAATKIFLSSAAKTDAAKEAIRYPIQLIDNSIDEIRSLSSRQVTPLKNIHLKEMIEALIDRMKENAKLTAVLDYNDHENQMADDLKLNIYRIIQEQVNNIIKYATAKNVLISIRTEKEGTHIVISDDGKGFDTGKKRKGIGISNMINRVEAFNGSIHIDSAPEMGCRVGFTIPATMYPKTGT